MLESSHILSESDQLAATSVDALFWEKILNAIRQVLYHIVF
jgi:hypothetical protein